MSHKQLNPEKLAELRELQGEDDLIGELVGMFKESAPKKVQAIIDAVAKKDAAAVGREAHSLKSSSANLGCETMAELSKKLEDLGRTGGVDGGAELARQLEAELKATLPLLEQEAARKAG